MKRLFCLLIVLFLLFSCKYVFRNAEIGNFTLVNYSNKVVEFIWIAPEGELYPISKNINISYGQTFDLNGLEHGTYDIAIDFKDEYNSFNSKKDKNLCLYIEKGIKKVWVISPSGDIERH